ncbi:Mpo1 family 2-hydroxy fatty acid dioxygenase [Hydrogenophaga sp.]|uniref:Mpo1 family 2-hydroxy fatty acid dioxygenase n=1 Tax=Hydrogenophaga sp. TaxID=1904254 RepID=UPI002FC608C1
MKTLTDHLSQYATYHRDRRNIVTHFVGIPMIVLSVVVLLARPSFIVAGLPVSLATLAVIAATLYYLRLDLRLGAVMGALLLGCLLLAQATAPLSLGAWATLGVGLFVVGWVIQFVGHIFEGRKPAFVDDISGLIIGPLFVVTEAGFLLALRPELEAQIEQRAGPVRSSRAGPTQAR